MSKDKNFKIVRRQTTPALTVGDFNIGDVFEREGSLHMRIQPTVLLHTNHSFNEVTVCNLNTGSAWVIPSKTLVSECINVKIEYQVDK
jgi:hypothetical protein